MCFFLFISPIRSHSLTARRVNLSQSVFEETKWDQNTDLGLAACKNRPHIFFASEANYERVKRQKTSGGHESPAERRQGRRGVQMAGGGALGAAAAEDGTAWLVTATWLITELTCGGRAGSKVREVYKSSEWDWSKVTEVTELSVSDQCEEKKLHNHNLKVFKTFYWTKTSEREAVN